MLLEQADPAPVKILNPQGRATFLLVGDHAGNIVPAALGTLGLPAAELRRHIGWDIGIAALGERLSAALDATFVRQTYSRLVIDCNRAHDAPDLIAPVSDGTIVPGNATLDGDARAARIAEIHEPYHRAIAAELDRRRDAGEATVLVALHSFTPAMMGQGAGHARPWQIGVLHHLGDTGFAMAFLAALRAGGDLTVGDNEPYRMDGIDHTVPRHAYPRGVPYVEIEVRQDLLGDAAGVAEWAARIEAALTTAGR